MEILFDSFPTIDDITSDEEIEMERAYWQQLHRADDYAAYVERMAVAEADEAEDDEPPPPAAPAVSNRPPSTRLWAVLLTGSAGRLAPTRAENREARRRRRAELDRAA